MDKFLSRFALSFAFDACRPTVTTWLTITGSMGRAATDSLVKINPEEKERKRADGEEYESDKKQKTKNENEDIKKRKREEEEQETEPEDYYKRNQGDRDGKPRAGVG